MLRTKIVCTIGPVSSSPNILEEMMVAGMDVVRLNFSHGDYAHHSQRIEMVRDISAKVGKPIAVLADLQGPKLRVGKMEGEGVPIRAGEELVLTTRAITGHEGEAPVQYQHLPQEVKKGEHILIDDGLLELEVLSATDTDIVTKVIIGGLLKSNKGLNLPHAAHSIPAITDKDREDLVFALEHQVDWIALSFVRTAEEVLELKELIRRHSTFLRPVPVVAKIEKPGAVDNIDAIIAASDGIMVARGDLGIELSPEEVPVVQKTIIHKCNEVGKPVITATQMLDSMMRNPRPTRAEASDVANAILDGTDAIMLSGETAVGSYPLEAVRTMVKIAQQVESSEISAPSECPLLIKRSSPQTLAGAVCHATRETAHDLNAAAIITSTVSGRTARLMSKYRPRCPILAATPSPMVQRQLMLYWGVYPMIARRTPSTDEMIGNAVEAAKAQKLVKEGDVVVVTAGAVGSVPGSTNLMKVHVIQRVLARGTGMGDKVVSGIVRVIDPPTEYINLGADEIIVAPRTDRTCLSFMPEAEGLVVVEGGANSHAAILAAETGIPTVIGVENALEVLKDGMKVTLDARRGLVMEAPR